MNVILALSIAVPAALVGAILLHPAAATSRRGIVFGVTLPLDFVSNDLVQTAIRRYRTRVALFSLVQLLVVLPLLAFFLHHPHPRLVLVDSILFVPALFLYALYMRAREAKRLRPYAITVPMIRTADLGSKPASLAPLLAAAAAFLPLALTAVWLRAHWDAIPARWPQHWNAAGHVNGWGTRTTGGVYGTLFAAVPVVLILLAILSFMSFAPGPDTRQRQRFLAPLATITWLMSLLFCTVALLPLWHLDETGVLLIIAVHVPLMLAVILWALWRAGMGQTTAALEAAPPYDATPDDHWRLGGLIYSNANDRALLIPKRFGMGWTFNMAHPGAWIFLAVLLILIAGAVALPLLLK